MTNYCGKYSSAYYYINIILQFLRRRELETHAQLVFFVSFEAAPSRARCIVVFVFVFVVVVVVVVVLAVNVIKVTPTAVVFVAVVIITNNIPT